MQSRVGGSMIQTNGTGGKKEKKILTTSHLRRKTISLQHHLQIVFQTSSNPCRCNLTFLVKIITYLIFHEGCKHAKWSKNHHFFV